MRPVFGPFSLKVLLHVGADAVGARVVSNRKESLINDDLLFDVSAVIDAVHAAASGANHQARRMQSQQEANTHASC